jgi:hexosaminidase
MLHVGGDEVPVTRWSACPKCRAKMAASHVGPAELESVFLHRVAEIVARLGRRMAVWDEAITKEDAAFPLPPDALVVAWQSMDRGRLAASRGYDVLMAPYDQTYFNFQQAHGNVEPGHTGYLPWSKVRRFDPVPAGLEAGATEHVLGAEGALWTEYVTTPADIETLVLPRMAALSEALWSGPEVPEPDFVARWNASLPSLDAAEVGYFVEPPDLGRSKTVFLESASLTMTRPALYPSGVVRWTEDGTLPAAGSALYEAPLSIHDTKTVAAALFLSSRHSPAVKAVFDRRVPRPGVDLPRPVAGASYTYFEGEFHKLPDLGRLPVRSKGRAAAIRLDEIARAIGPSMRKEDFALAIEAFFRVPTDGVYRLIAKADDGIKVEVDGELVVDDDGDHGPRESDGQVALGAGYPALRIGYYQAAGGATLTLDVEGDGLPRAPVEPFVR